MGAYLTLSQMLCLGGNGIELGLHVILLRLVSHKLFQSYLLLFEVQKAEGFPTLSLYLFPIHYEGEILEV